jgi:hypothetical protein
MAQHRLGHQIDLLARFPTSVAGAALTLGVHNESEERAAEALLRAHERVAKANLG